MTEHKVKSQSDFSTGRRVFSRQVTLTCTCGRKFIGSYAGRRQDKEEYMEHRALEKAEQIFREHIPIR